MDEVEVVNERAQQALERKERTAKRANEEKRLKAEYHKIKDSEALQDLLVKSKSFLDYHTQVARDGVGYKIDAEGKQEIVHLGNERRVSELDKAAGISEIIDYLERKLTIESSINKKGKDDGQ